MTPSSLPDDTTPETDAPGIVPSTETARTNTLPSVHIRAALTWLAIFPLVSVGMLAFASLWEGWHPIMRALVLTLLVVPLAVYLVVPQLLRGYGAATRRASRSRRGRA